MKSISERAAREVIDRCGGYWSEHPRFPVADWKYEINNDDTRACYWDWVVSKEYDEEE